MSKLKMRSKTRYHAGLFFRESRSTSAKNGATVPRRNDIKKILIIGSGPIVIGQACEFDYSGTQACTGCKTVHQNKRIG